MTEEEKTEKYEVPVVGATVEEVFTYIKMTLPSGNKYEGGWKDGKPHGKGTYTLFNGIKHEGEWENGLKYGQGIIRYKSGSKYEGEIKNDKPHGQGTMTYIGGSVESGIWEEGRLISN